MKKTIGLLALFIIAALITCSAVALESRSIVIMGVSGEVFMSTGGRAEFPAKAGVALRAGFSVRTAGDGEAYLMIDDDKLIKLAPNSDIMISQADDKLIITMRAGEMVFNVTQEQPEDSVEFLSGGVSMGIRGTAGYLKRIKDALNSAIECGLFEGEVSLRAEKLLLLIEAMEVDAIPSRDGGELTTGNGSLFALLSALEEQLGIDLPDGFMDDEDIKRLSQLWEELLELDNQIEEGARRYLSDADIVTLAKGAIAKLVYEPQPYSATEEEIIEYINTLLAPIAEEYGVEVLVNTIEMLAPKNATYTNRYGTVGEYQFDVTVTRNAATANTEPQAIEITPKKLTSNQQKLATHRRAVQKLEIEPLYESDAEDEDSIQSYIISCITDALEDPEVEVSLNCEWVKPISGDADNPDGTPGSYTYTVTLKRGKDKTTTGNKTLVINPEAYEGLSNADFLKQVIQDFEAELSDYLSIDAIDISEAREFVDFIFWEMLGNPCDYVIEASSERFTPATDGTESAPDGTPGKYTFKLTLTKDKTSLTTDAYTLGVNAKSYADVEKERLLKELIAIVNAMAFEGIHYTDAPDWPSASDYLTNTIRLRLDEEEFTLPEDETLNIVCMNTGSTEPTYGDAESPDGVSGLYNFVIDLQLSSPYYSERSDDLTLEIFANYLGESNQQLADRLAGLLDEASPFYTTWDKAGTMETASAVLFENAEFILDQHSESYTLNVYQAEGESEEFTQAFDGDADQPDGYEGNYQCRLEVGVGSRRATTGTITLYISGKPYGDLSNADYIRQVIDAFERTLTDWQSIDALDISEAREFISFMFIEMLSEYVIEYAIPESSERFTPATDGTESAPDGAPGSYTFALTLTKGNTSITTDTYMLDVNPLDYDEAQNKALVDRLISIVNEMSFETVSIKTYQDWYSAITYLEYEIYAYLEEATGISPEDVILGFGLLDMIEPIAGDENSPNGTPGSYTFQVYISCDPYHYEAESIDLTLGIIDPYLAG